MNKLFSLLMLCFFFLGCEKDDICANETTPRLIIEFFDIANPSVKKNVSNLLVKGIGQANALKTFNAVNKIELPLKIDTSSTQYSLQLNSTSTTLQNEDILEFNYSKNTVYVSRACGYKTVFQLNTSNGIIVTDSATADNLWMQNVVITTNSVTTENETHVKIFF